MSSGGSDALCIMLLTAHRADYAMITLQSTLRHMPKDVMPIHLHIASDGDDKEYIDDLVELAKRDDVRSITMSNSEGRGYGANYNLATQIIHQGSKVKYVLPLEDDWELTRDFPLRDIVSALSDGSDIGCVRLGYIGFTQPLLGRFVSRGGHLLLHLDPASPEPHVFAGHPRLETVAWERAVGPWPEGLLPGATEFEVAHIPEARQGVAWPISLVNPCGDLFVHIGTERSY